MFTNGVRPREHSDQELIELAVAAITRRQGGAWSLADIARDSGVHSATFIKRFGSKQGLSLAMSRAWIASIPTAPRTADPEAELRNWIRESYGSFGDPTNVASSMASLSADLADPVLRQALADGWRAQTAYVRQLLESAVGNGRLLRLPHTDHATAVLLAASEGAVIRWFADPRRPLADTLDLILSTLLASWE
jgi:AcrR family transcriptional regulator